MDDCKLCKIVEGNIPSNRVYEDEHVLAFAPLEKDILTKGHMIVIPKKHYENIYDITIDELTFLMRAVKLISKRLKESMGADGINILHASGKSAQQSTPHFHLHLAPRYADDGLDTWPKTGFRDTEFPEVYKKMRELFKD